MILLKGGLVKTMAGPDIENGEVPYTGYEAERVNQMIEDICYNNAKNYFNFK